MPYSNEKKEFTIEPGCPWYEAQQSYGAPNVNWCEPTTCSYINEPANTWSNIGYLLLAFILLKKIKSYPNRFFPITVIIVGILSATYHASNNYLTQFLDFFGMFMMMSFLLAFNFKRLPIFKTFNFYSFYWFFVCFNTSLFIGFDILNWPAQPILLVNTLPIVALDLFNGFKEKRLHQYLYFVACVVFLVTAQFFAILDITRSWCEPENLFLHGHVLWHVFSSIGLFFGGLHIQRVSEKP